MKKLVDKHCTSSTDARILLTGSRLKVLYEQLDPTWKLINEQKIEKEYKFKDFSSALRFVDKIGEIAEEEDHHPEIFLAWGLVKMTLSTHSVNGLSENDFILAAKCDEVINNG